MRSIFAFSKKADNPKNIRIIEFKPKKILPAKNSLKNIASFKQEFIKLLK